MMGPVQGQASWKGQVPQQVWDNPGIRIILAMGSDVVLKCRGLQGFHRSVNESRSGEN